MTLATSWACSERFTLRLRQVRALAEAGERRREHVMAAIDQQVRHLAPAPSANPCAMDDDNRCALASHLHRTPGLEPLVSDRHCGAGAGKNSDVNLPGGRIARAMEQYRCAQAPCGRRSHDGYTRSHGAGLRRAGARGFRQPACRVHAAAPRMPRGAQRCLGRVLGADAARGCGPRRQPTATPTSPRSRTWCPRWPSPDAARRCTWIHRSTRPIGARCSPLMSPQRIEPLRAGDPQHLPRTARPHGARRAAATSARNSPRACRSACSTRG